MKENKQQNDILQHSLPDEQLSIKKAATALNITSTTLRNWHKNTNLPK